MNHSDFYHSYLKTFEWGSLRNVILRRAHGRCERCGDLTSSLQVHHKHYDSLGRELLP